MLKNLCLLVLLFLISACSTAKYNVKIETFGEQDLDKNERLALKAKELDWSRDYPVKVMAGSLPAGLELDQNGSKLIVKAGYQERFEVLGTVTSEFQDFNQVFMGNWIWYPSLHETHSSGRDIYCKIQTPFKIVTLGIWSIIPFNIPCIAKYPTGIENKKYHEKELKRGAFAMGANLLILAQHQDTKITQVVGNQYGVSVNSTTVSDSGMTAFAVKVTNKKVKNEETGDAKTKEL